MRYLSVFTLSVLLIGASATINAQSNQNALVVTTSNTAQNLLLVYDASDNLIQTLSMRGQGGVSGNSGGVAAQGDLVAAVNFGSKSVAVFERADKGLQFMEMVSTVASPVSVAFGHDHLYILGTTKVESHKLYGSYVNGYPDGVVSLLLADGSAAQVGVLNNEVIITEKNNVIETVNLLEDGSVSGIATLVQNIPQNVNAPFGLVTRGNNAYVTIAHADEISLVRNGAVLTTTGSGTQHAPCWVALAGPFLYSSNSPSMSVSRYAVYGQKIVQDAAVAATFNGSPTDIASGDGLIAVVDGSGKLSHLSVFQKDEDGNLTLVGAATINSAANGVAIVRSGMQD
jgi:hypothetical protein